MKKHPVWHSVALLAVAIAFSSCAAPIVPRRVAFNEAAFARNRTTGSGSVVGQAFTVLKNGSARFVQFDMVDLAPVNDYTTEVIERRFKHGENLAAADPRYFKYLHSGKTDEHGNFEIHHVPPGDYYVGTQATWQHNYTTTDSDGNSQEESSVETQYIYQQISVKDGQTIKVTDWNQGS